MTTVRWVVGAVVVGLLVGACGAPGTPDEPIALDGPATPDEPGSQARTVEVEVEVYFTNDSDTFRGDPCLDVFPVSRTVPADDPATGAITAVLAGPTAAERADGYLASFSAYAEGALVAVEVIDGTAWVTFSDLRDAYTHGSWCTATELLTSLDRTLLALDHVDVTRYLFDAAETGAFYSWLHLAAPDTARPEPATPPSGGPVDLDAGWSTTEPSLPIELGCCGLQTTGPVSPDGPLPDEGWPDDGFYHVLVYRPVDDPTMLEFTIRRWVACRDLPEEPCAPDPEPGPGEPDARITADPSDAVTRSIDTADLEVVLFPIGEPEVIRQEPLHGEPPAFATLLSAGLDPAFRKWIEEPILAGRTPAQVDGDLRRFGRDPSFAFDSAFRYRGPLDSRLMLSPAWDVLDRWPRCWDGLYDWPATLEIRDGAPLLYVFAGRIAG